MAVTLASRWYRCKTNRAARRWTISTCLVRVMLVGSHTVLLYSFENLSHQGFIGLLFYIGVSDVDVPPHEVQGVICLCSDKIYVLVPAEII